ncbi:MAG TPA: hypothetical protein VK466_12410, partial [Terriglobales bacterium]|nr:hypothetical protein [Terriglobales bacterium]
FRRGLPTHEPPIAEFRGKMMAQARYARTGASRTNMIQEMIAAKVNDVAGYPDLINGGFSPAYTFKCHACEVAYRLFHRSFGGNASVLGQAAQVTAFESCVENSHPAHPDRIWVKRQL